MAIRGFEKKDSMSGLKDLLQTISMFEQMGARTENQLATEMLALSKQIENSKNLDTLTNISPSVNKFNTKVSSMGYDQYSLKSLVDEKTRIYKESKNSFEESKKYLDQNLGDPDVLYDKIMGMSWGQANEELANLYSLTSRMNEGIKAGHSYKSEGKYTPSALGKAINTRIGQISNKLDVFAENEGKFLVYNADGTMDEASLAMYKDLQFKILSGDTKDFDKYFDDQIDGISRKFQIEEKGYNDWLKIYEQSKASKKLTDMDLSDEEEEQYSAIMGLSGEDADGVVDPMFAKQMAENYRTNSVKYNSQHEVLTGKKYNENPVYMNIDLEESVDIPGTESESNAAKVDTNDKKEAYADDLDTTKSIEIKEEEKVPTGKLSLDWANTNLKKENNVWKVYDNESKSYINLPKENIEKIMINGELREVPVMRGERKIRKKDGSTSIEKGIITHIYVRGKWKKASVPEPKKKKPKKVPRVSGTIKKPKFEPIYEEGEFEDIKKGRNKEIWNKFLNYIRYN